MRQVQGQGRKLGRQGKVGSSEGAGKAQEPAALLRQGLKEATPASSPREDEVMNQAHTESPVSRKKSQDHR